MTHLTRFFTTDATTIASCINGGDRVVLTGFAPKDLQHGDWAQPGIATIAPDPDQPSLDSAIARKHNQVRIAMAIAWLMSLAACAAITYVLTSR